MGRMQATAHMWRSGDTSENRSSPSTVCVSRTELGAVRLSGKCFPPLNCLDGPGGQPSHRSSTLNLVFSAGRLDLCLCVSMP